MNIIKFNWDNAKGEDHNGMHLMIGQHLPKSQNLENSHVNIYGISLDIADVSKDYNLKRFTCFSQNVVGEVETITKTEARRILLEEIDKALDVLFDETEMTKVGENLNVPESHNDFLD